MSNELLIMNKSIQTFIRINTADLSILEANIYKKYQKYPENPQISLRPLTPNILR